METSLVFLGHNVLKNYGISHALGGIKCSGKGDHRQAWYSACMSEDSATEPQNPDTVLHGFMAQTREAGTLVSLPYGASPKH